MYIILTRLNVTQHTFEFRSSGNVLATLTFITVDGSYRLGDESDITIGERCYLLLPNGGIVRTSPVCSWRKYGGFYITTKHTQYYISCDNIHVQ